LFRNILCPIAFDVNSLRALPSARLVLGIVFERSTIERLYADLASYNYSSEVLQKCPVDLAVLPVNGVGWSDLGEPERVIKAWARLGIRPSEISRVRVAARNVRAQIFLIS
jgi:hypothetical protein